MAKDYAKRVFTTTRKPQKKRRRIEFIILPVVLLAVIGGYWGYLHRADFLAPTNGASFLARVKAIITHKKIGNNPEFLAKKQSNIETQNSDDVHFDFYNELPKMQVTATQEQDDEKPVHPSKPIIVTSHDEIPQAVDSSHPYYLLLGSFKNENDASQSRLSLLLAGYEAVVSKINTDKGVIYHVQSAPIANMTEAKKQQRDLDQKGFVSTLKKV